jgi:hypothetical protein
MKNLASLSILFLTFISHNIALSNTILDCDIIIEKHNAVNIEIVPEVELFLTICYISDQYPGINKLDFKYKSDIDEYFGKYKNHSTISLIKEIMNNHYSPNLMKVYILNNQFKEDSSNVKLLRMGNDYQTKVRLIDSLRTSCKRFAEDTNFKNFFYDRKSYYIDKIKEVKSVLKGKSVIPALESFWGIKKDKYRIIISLLESDLHSCWFKNDNLSYSIYFLTPKFSIEGDAKFGNANTSNLKEGKMSASDYIYYGSGHEFGHSFLNPITIKFESQINKINFDITKSGQPTKVDFFNESILRTYTAYEFLKEGKEDIANMVIQGEQMNGYIYNSKILELIQFYESNRNLYQRFEDFLPYLLNKLIKEINEN